MPNPNQSQAKPGIRSSTPTSQAGQEVLGSNTPAEIPAPIAVSLPAQRKWESLPGWNDEQLNGFIIGLQAGNDDSEHHRLIADFLIEALSAYRALLVGIRTRQELELDHPQGFNPVPSDVTITKLQLSDQGITHCEQLLEALKPFRTPPRDDSALSEQPSA